MIMLQVVQTTPIVVIDSSGVAYIYTGFLAIATALDFLFFRKVAKKWKKNSLASLHNLNERIEILGLLGIEKGLAQKRYIKKGGLDERVNLSAFFDYVPRILTWALLVVYFLFSIDYILSNTQEKLSYMAQFESFVKIDQHALFVLSGLIIFIALAVFFKMRINHSISIFEVKINDDALFPFISYYLNVRDEREEKDFEILDTIKKNILTEVNCLKDELKNQKNRTNAKFRDVHKQINK